MMMMMMKLPILPCAEKPQSYFSLPHHLLHKNGVKHKSSSSTQKTNW